MPEVKHQRFSRLAATTSIDNLLGKVCHHG
jgi:hypothetical protein